MSTTPRSKKLPTLNFDALALEINRQVEVVDGMQISTRSQQRLETAEKERAELEKQQAIIRTEAAKTRTNLESLQRLLAAQEGVEADISIDLNAVQETIHSLRQSGVTLP